MIETRVLRQFVAVAEELHFHRAAQRLNMAQPPLSQAIRKLEDEIGARLFERTKRNVMLTPAGASFLETARRVLAQVEEGAERSRRIAMGIEGRLSIMFLDTAHYDLLPLILRTFKARYPNIELVLRVATTMEQIREIEAGQAEVGLIRQPGVPSPRITTERLRREAILAALPRDHALASRKSVPLKALANEAFIATARVEGPGFHDQLITLCRLAGFSPRIIQEAKQVQTVIGLVAGGLGVALVPDSLTHTRRDDVVFRPLAIDAPKRLTHVDLLMAWDASRASPARDNFLKVARDAAAR
jgi:DNA-binding transcriptional LysR family regulator